MNEVLMFLDLENRQDVPILEDPSGAQFFVLDPASNPRIVLINALAKTLAATGTVTVSNTLPPNPSEGQLVMINQDIAGGLPDILSAKAGDIVEFLNGRWQVVLSIQSLIDAHRPLLVGTALPAEPVTNQLVLFSADVASGLADITSAKAGDIALYNGTSWSRVFRLPAGQQNPLHIVKFSAIDGDATNLQNFVIGLYNGSSPVQNGSITQVNTIHIAENMGTFNAADPTTSTPVPVSRLFGDRVDNGGSVVFAIHKEGSTDFQYVQAETIVRRTGGYTCTNLTWFGDYIFDSGAGNTWQVVVGNTLRFTKDIVDLATFYAKLDGSNLTEAFRRAVQRFNEEIDLTGTYQRVDALSVPTAGQWTIAGTPTLTSAAQVQFAPKTADVTPFTLGIAAGTYIDLSATCTVEVTYASISVANNLWTFAVTLVEGTLPAVNASNPIHLEGADIHRTEIAREAFRAHRPNIQGDDGNKGQAFTINSSGEIEWQDYVPLDAIYTRLFNRTEGTGLTTENGESYLSSDNTPPSGAPSNATTFFAMDHHTSGGTDQSALLNAIKAGEWLYVRVGDTYVNARIQFVDEVKAQYATRFWIIPSEAHQHTHAYETLATGAATIAFTNIIPDLDDLVDGTPADKDVIAWNNADGQGEWVTRGRGEKLFTSNDLAANGSFSWTRSAYAQQQGYTFSGDDIQFPSVMPESRGVSGLLIVGGRVSSGTFTPTATQLIPWGLYTPDATSTAHLVLGNSSNGGKIQIQLRQRSGSEWHLNNIQVQQAVTGETYRIEVYEWHG